MAKRANKPMPDEATLIKLAISAIRHAREQLQDAEALFARGRWAAALVSAALGMEEVGKSYLCTAALSLTAELRVSQAAFWRTFDSHTAKAVLAQTQLALFDAASAPDAATLFADVAAAGAKVNDAKFRGLYVDVADNGDLTEPDDVAAADARAVVDQLERALNGPRARGVDGFEGEDPAQVAEFIAWWRTNGDPTAFLEAAETEDDAARMLVALGEHVRGQGPAPDWIRTSMPGLFDDESAPEI